MDKTIEINGVKYVKQGADFQSQINKTVDLLGFDMHEALVEAKAIIAGGAVLSHFTHQEVNDVDVYFRSKESMLNAFMRLTRGWDSVYLGHTEKSITLKDRQTESIVQFIYFDYFKDAEEVFKAFDFTICMAAIELGEDPQLVMHPQFLSDVASRTLHFNAGTKYPYISLIRTRKYQEKGYKIGKGNLLSIALSCSQISINSWDDAKSQLGGIYGYVINLEIDENTEFSTEKLHEVITRIKDGAFSANPKNYEQCVEMLSGKAYDEYIDELEENEAREADEKRAQQNQDEKKSEEDIFDL